MQSQTYKSKARIVVIPFLQLIRPKFLKSGELFDYSYSHVNAPTPLNFPVIINSNGTPWEIANNYLINISTGTTRRQISAKTLRGTADDLLNLLRFLEDNDLNLLHLPKNERLRTTYRYLNHINDLILSGSIRHSTGKQRINRMVNFYKGILDQGLISERDLESTPFDETLEIIKTLDGKGLTRSTMIHRHNLRVKGSNEAPDPRTIIDDGSLTPLRRDEQIALLKALKDSNNRAMQLIFYFSLFTGARIQSCCTLKIKHLYGKQDSDSNLRLRIGLGTGIDNKNGKNMTLIVPGWLVEDLKIYSQSPKSQKHQNKSKIGISEENYVFLTNRGYPYYTSQQEIAEHLKSSDLKKNSKVSHLRIYDGTTIRVFLSGLLKSTTPHHPGLHKFSFHDLRATFGMNLLERLLENPMHSINSALAVVQQRMGHRDVEVTLRYLNHRAFFNSYMDTQDAYEEELMQYVKSEHP